MHKIKKIAWESWNSKVEESLSDNALSEASVSLLEDSDDEYPLLAHDLLFQNKIVHTPMGPYPQDSLLKPSDRWDCWIGHTNFDVTVNIAEIIEKIEGVEALKIMGRYSFFIGVARLFNIKHVRKDIENAICNYTEEEILSDNDLRQTVDLVKKQLQSVDYWSILVSPDGEVEYIASDKMDKTYLDGLNKLTVMKNKKVGIILRGTNG